MKGYKEFLARKTDTESDVVDEGSGVITNTLASSLLKKVSALEKKVMSSRKLETKIDLLAQQNTKLAGLDAIAIAVSGDAKGIFDKGSRLLSIIRAIK
tara:strand:+ start:66 stop:359 length:294 start_codon:yes stop_codon:yes gene_type:complete